MAGVKERLAARFFEVLVAAAPASVLDVGCGDGGLLAACAGAGIEACGVEPDTERVAAAVARGLAAEVGRAEALPFEAGQFDWVTLRHVSHHLADERPALAEAFRVARTGVLVAEPWLDASIPSQRVARRLDAWLARQNERHGRVHRMPVSVGEFLAAVPAAESVVARAEYHLICEPRPEDHLATECAPFVADLDAAGRTELQAIEAAARTVGLSYNGTAILTLRR